MICIHEGTWTSTCGKTIEGPKYGEECIITESKWKNYCIVFGYEGSGDFAYVFQKKWFVKPGDISELTEVLESQTVEA